MLCAISGESPQDPVVSTKSGNVFERRLVEAYISENGKDPVTGEDMTVEDLIGVKSSRVVRPRPPTFTSIPSLLSVFQKEWDALALESYNVREQLSQTRQELATALYQHDAAVRVIARLTKERDEARDALSKVTVTAVGASNGDAMQVDNAGLPEELAEKVDATNEKLTKSRRKRPVPKGWANSAAIESYSTKFASGPLYSGTVSFAVDSEGEQAIVGGAEGIAGVYSLTENKMLQVMKVGAGSITDAVWFGSQPVLSTASGAVKVFDMGSEVTTFTSHAGAATALALHPTGDILASVGVDKSFVFYDLLGAKAVTQVYTDSGLTTAAFHPDGHVFAAGGVDGQIKFYHVKSAEFAAAFDCGGPVRAISFSENGIWFAATAGGSTTVSIFDIRKPESGPVKVVDTGSRVDSIQWDYTGQFLATGGPSGVTVQQYIKSSKTWAEPLRSAVQATAVAWGPQAENLITVNVEGIITVLG